MTRDGHREAGICTSGSHFTRTFSHIILSLVRIILATLPLKLTSKIMSFPIWEQRSTAMRLWTKSKQQLRNRIVRTGQSLHLEVFDQGHAPSYLALLYARGVSGSAHSIYFDNKQLSICPNLSDFLNVCPTRPRRVLVGRRGLDRSGHSTRKKSSSTIRGRNTSEGFRSTSLARWRHHFTLMLYQASDRHHMPGSKIPRESDQSDMDYFFNSLFWLRM